MLLLILLYMGGYRQYQIVDFMASSSGPGDQVFWLDTERSFSAQRLLEMYLVRKCGLIMYKTRESRNRFLEMVNFSAKGMTLSNVISVAFHHQ